MCEVEAEVADGDGAGEGVMRGMDLVDGVRGRVTDVVTKS